MKKLPIEQRIMLEKLTGRHTKMDGTPRKYPRNGWESERQGFPIPPASGAVAKLLAMLKRAKDGQA
jgi:hypothetical protein